MTALLEGLPPLLASHLAIVLVALGVAIALALPLAIAVARRPRLAAAIVAVAGAIQTIPGLALLALMVPVLAAIARLGAPVSPFGFAPATVALVLYALLPIVRNAIVGIGGVDPAVREAAIGMGMTRGQLRRIVELPLAAPVIAAGIRTAAAWTVGAATLATPVGQPCLGNYIFAGLQTRNFDMLLIGVVAAAALALVLDAILAALARALAGHHRRRAWAPAAALAALAVIVIAIVPRAVAPSGPAVAVGPATGSGAAPAAVATVRVGGKTFTEQYILIEVIRARLARAGVAAEVVPSLGSNVVFDALARGELDVYVDYSGTLWTNRVHGAPGLPRWRILAELEAWLARTHGIRSLGSLGFENAYAFVVRPDTAAAHHLRSIADLAPVAPELALGGDYEFFSRAEWTAVRARYGLRFARTTSFDPALLYDAVARRDVDVIAGFSSDGRIAADDLVVLSDPASALPPYDAILLLGPRVADDPRVACALAPLRGAIPVERMRRANLMVDRDTDRATPAEAAAWLLAEARLPPPTCP